jgi:hypothetical protein
MHRSYREKSHANWRALGSPRHVVSVRMNAISFAENRSEHSPQRRSIARATSRRVDALCMREKALSAVVSTRGISRRAAPSTWLQGHADRG